MADDGRISLFNFSLDDLTQDTAVGPIGNAIANNIFGINHRQTPAAIPLNRDQYGYAFFTRPQLNLQTINIRNVRLMLPMLTTSNVSYQNAIRNLLDPRIGLGWGGNDAIPSDFVDANQVFIPMLTNNIVSMSGWRDMVMPIHSAQEGQYREGWSIPDGVVIDYTTFDLSCSFRNTIGDPITQLFFYWLIYMAAVFEGVLMPYPDFLLQNEIDYNTRIYRLVMDKTKTRVQRIAATGAAFPTSVPIGGLFNFNVDKPYNDVNAEINIQFHCMGAIYNDDILIHEFNSAVGIFNPELRNVAWSFDPDRKRNKINSSEMTLIDYDLLQLFNMRGYPYIDPKTYELQWYVQTELFNSKLASQSTFLQNLLTPNSLRKTSDDKRTTQSI